MQTKTNLNLTFAFGYILFLSSIGQIASDIYLPSLPAIQLTLNSSINTIQLSVALYMYGYGLMQIFYGPFSDAFGRKPALLLGLFVMLLGTIFCMHANSAAELLIGRLLQGVGGASCNAIYKACMRDLFPSRLLPKVSSIFAVVTVLMISIAPLAGGFIQEYLGWRWTFFFLLSLICILIVVVSITPETNRYLDKTHINKEKIILNFKELLSSKTFSVFAFANALCYGGLLCWLTTGPFLIMTVHDKTAIEFGYISTMVGMAFAVGGTINSFIVKPENIITIVRVSFITMLFAGILLLASMLLDHDFYAMILSITLFSFAGSFVVPNAIAMCLQPFKRIAGLSGALLGFIKNLGGAIMSSIIALAPDSNQMPLAIAYLLIALLGIIAVFKYLPKDVLIYNKNK